MKRAPELCRQAVQFVRVRLTKVCLGLVMQGLLSILAVICLTSIDWWAASRDPMRLRLYATALHDIQSGTQMAANDFAVRIGLLALTSDVASTGRIENAFARRRLDRGEALSQESIHPEPVMDPPTGKVLVPVGVNESGVSLIRPGMWIVLRKEAQGATVRLGPARVIAVARATQGTLLLVLALSEVPSEVDGWVAAISGPPMVVDATTGH